MAKTTKTKSREKIQSKADFVRNLPSTMPGNEVIEKGKAAGIRLSKNYVYRVRTWANAATRAQAKKAPEKEVTTKGGAAKEPAGSKAGWVRARPHLSPKEIVEQAAARGIKFGVHYVYNVRRHDTASGAGKKGREARAIVDRKGAAVPRPITSASRAESLLKAVAAEIGLGRALEILEGERARVRAAIGD
jgi:hypothetical protein